jgi:hypothetical protein
MMNSIAILNSVGRVITFVRADVPNGWTPPDGCTAVPDDQLPDGWEYEPERHDMDEVRANRNERLSASDWTQVADAPVNQEAWATYRQALRDLPEIYSGEGPIPWPQEPA